MGYRTVLVILVVGFCCRDWWICRTFPWIFHSGYEIKYLWIYSIFQKLCVCESTALTNFIGKAEIDFNIYCMERSLFPEYNESKNTLQWWRQKWVIQPESRKRVILPGNQNEAFWNIPTFCGNFWHLDAVNLSDYPIN